MSDNFKNNWQVASICRSNDHEVAEDEEIWIIRRPKKLLDQAKNTTFEDLSNNFPKLLSLSQEEQNSGITHLIFLC